MISVEHIIAARNDNYLGASVSRLIRVLQECNKHGLPVTIADWGSTVPLATALRSSGVRARFLHVPPAIAEKWKTPFSEVHALNLAARRCSADWIGRLDQDTMPGPKYVEWLRAGIARSVIFPDSMFGGRMIAWFAGRRDLRDGETECNPDAPLNITGPDYYKGAVGVLLVPATAWRETRGYDERMIQRAHMEHDFCARLKITCGLEDLGKLVDYDFHHLWHVPAQNRQYNQVPNIGIIMQRGQRAVNGEDWGLRQFDDQIVETIL